ncbi:MAG: hypothetical protein GX234_02570 [Clostridiales bacterium]|nr:hypothetical protein [Clostridiales bacterium]
MDKVIREYLQGDFCYESGTLEFSCPRLELNIKKGEVYRGSFRIIAEGGREIEGTVLSHQNRMVCETVSFQESEAEIFYTFDGRGMEEGEVLKGEIQVISNRGEYALPYVVNVEYFRLESSLGDIKNLFHFANLARTSWEEAVRLFYSPDFAGIFKGNDRQYLEAYRLLKTPKGNGQNVEEFLLEIRKKQPIEFLVEKEELVYRDLAGVTAEILEVSRNGWGYTCLKVRTEGDFLSVEKEVLTEDDFLGNVCKCVFYMDAQALHAGNNYGCIILQNSYQELRIPVIVQNGTRLQAKRIRMHKKHLTLQLMQYYLAFRMKKIGQDTWLEETEKIIEEWNAVDSRSVSCHLFRAQLLMTQERYNEAKWLLERVEPFLGYEMEEDDKDSLHCYYLYLKSLLLRDVVYTGEVTREIRSVYRAHPGKWRIAWLLLYLEDEYDRNVSRKWMLLEELFYQGIHSPVFYIEALELIGNNPTLMMRLREFEIQILIFGARNDILTEDIIYQIHYLAGRSKQFSAPLYEILRACYKKNRDDESLQAVCTLLIKGNKTGPEYFRWYGLAVERELRIMRLYEYYMMSMPRDYQGEIPRMVLMYFAYRSALDYEQNALLYAYVVKHREEQPEMFRTYQADMERFIGVQLSHGRVNRELAYLYKNMVNENILKEYASAYIKAAFSCCICVEDEDIRNVVVLYSRKKTEELYPVVGKRAYVPLYGEELKICLQDQDGNRYVAGKEYQTEKLFLAGSMLRQAAEYVTEDVNLDLYFCQNGRACSSVDEFNVARAARVEAQEQVQEDYRREMAVLLLKYYFEHDKDILMDRLLQRLSPEGFTAARRAGILRYMVLREQYEKALSWVDRYGTAGLDPKTIVRLCTRVLESHEYREDERFTNIIYYAFQRGKYNEEILQYLVMHFEGTTKQMRDIWKAAKNFEVDTYALEGRLLLQLLYTDSYVGEGVQIFESYVSKTPRTEIALAFLSYLSFDYFVKEKVMEPFVWKQVEQMYIQKEELPFVVKAAWMKHLAEQPELSERQRQAVGEITAQFLKQDIYFPFFRRFIGISSVLDQFLDKTVLEYRTSPDSRVIIHYLIEKEQNEEPQYCTEEMQHMYGGIFVRQFILFFGETLQYYITEENDGKSVLTASGTLTNNEVGRDQDDTRYGMLGDIVTAWKLQDYDTVDGLLGEYYEKDYLVQKLFELE